MPGFIEREGTRLLPAVLSLLMLIWFMLPLFRGIVNAGGIFGAAVSGGLAAAFIFRSRTAALISSLRSTRAGRAAFAVLCILAVLFTVYAAAISVFMIRSARNRPPSGDTTLVVLGCRVKNGEPSRMLRKRLDRACSYLEGHSGTRVVVSGGKGSDEKMSEAQCMKDYLVRRGIAPERIYMEDRSYDTSQNLRYSMELIRREGLCEEITIVTDGYHQLRASMLAKKQGIRTHSLSASTSWWLLPSYWVREWLGIAYYSVKGDV